MAGVAVFVSAHKHGVVVIRAFVDCFLVREVIQHSAVDASLLEQVGIDPAHVFVLGRQCEGLTFTLAGLDRGGGDVLAEKHLHGILKISVEILLGEVYRRAALAFVLVEPGVPPDCNVVIGPFQLRARASQLLVAGFEEKGEVGVLGGMDLLGREGDES